MNDRTSAVPSVPTDSDPWPDEALRRVREADARRQAQQGR